MPEHNRQIQHQAHKSFHLATAAIAHLLIMPPEGILRDASGACSDFAQSEPAESVLAINAFSVELQFSHNSAIKLI